MNKWKEILSTLILFTGITVFILASQNKTSATHSYVTKIPKQTTAHFLINSNFLLKELLISEIFEAKDEFVIDKIKAFSQLKRNQKSQIKNLSINIFEPIEFFTIKTKTEVYKTLKFKIVNKKVFDRNCSNKQNKIGFFRHNNTGFIVFSANNTNAKYLKNLLFSNCRTLEIENNNKSQYFTFFENSKIKYNGAIETLNNAIVIRTKTNEKVKKNSALKPRGFHLSTKINTANLQSIEGASTFKLFSPEKIDFISLNYFGIEIKENSFLPAVPKMDLLLSYSSKINLDSILYKFSHSYGIEFSKISNETYFLKNINLEIKQLSSNQIYLSSTSNKPNTIALNEDFYISGNANNLVKIENAGWKSLFLELIPMFKTSKTFINKTKNITTERINDKEQKITLQFKNKANSFHEILKLIVSIQD